MLGTSRGGLNALGLAKGAKDRLLGVAFNDVGPHIDPQGLDFIMGYIGRNPAAKTHAEAAAAMPRVFPEFDDVPDSRWMEEAQKHYTQTESGLQITYDKHLRDAVAKAFSAPSPTCGRTLTRLTGCRLPASVAWRPICCARKPCKRWNAAAPIWWSRGCRDVGIFRFWTNQRRLRP